MGTPTWDVVAQGGSGALLGACVLAVIRGWLVPSRSADRLLQVQADQLAAARLVGDQWREAYLAERARADEALRQLDKALSAGETTYAVVEALRRAAEGQPRALGGSS